MKFNGIILVPRFLRILLNAAQSFEFNGMKIDILSVKNVKRKNYFDIK